VAGCREDRAVVCLEHVQPVGDVGGVVFTRLKRQIKVGTEERSAEFRHQFFDRVAFGPETFDDAPRDVTGIEIASRLE
jgi:hypothetical protein